MNVKTPKGTELRIIDLKGKAYLPVQQRIVWFREERPNWGIEVELISYDDSHSIAKATIKDEAGRIIAQDFKTETKEGFGDFIEKSITGAIGRAVANCGFGTQFAVELDEGEDRIADAPVAPNSRRLIENKVKTIEAKAKVENRSLTESEMANIADLRKLWLTAK